MKFFFFKILTERLCPQKKHLLFIIGKFFRLFTTLVFKIQFLSGNRAGRLELSNNRAERSIKPFVMGRKNWLFSNTPAGAQSSAVIYSLIETAQENDLDPYRYLVWLLNTAPGLSQKDEAWAESFLPMNVPQKCKIPKP